MPAPGYRRGLPAQQARGHTPRRQQAFRADADQRHGRPSAADRRRRWPLATSPASRLSPARTATRAAPSSQGDIGWSRREYVNFVEVDVRRRRAAVLARYPWPADADRFTARLPGGAIFTDSGLAAGIGGCSAAAARSDPRAVRARRSPTSSTPARVPASSRSRATCGVPGHAAELAYLFPSFNNGTPIAPTFNAGERQLSRNMINYWGSFVFHGDPNFPGQADWPQYNSSHQVMSLRVAGQSRADQHGRVPGRAPVRLLGLARLTRGCRGGGDDSVLVFELAARRWPSRRSDRGRPRPARPVPRCRRSTPLSRWAGVVHVRNRVDAWSTSPPTRTAMVADAGGRPWK